MKERKGKEGKVKEWITPQFSVPLRGKTQLPRKGYVTKEKVDIWPSTKH